MFNFLYKNINIIVNIFFKPLLATKISIIYNRYRNIKFVIFVNLIINFYILKLYAKLNLDSFWFKRICVPSIEKKN